MADVLTSSAGAWPWTVSRTIVGVMPPAFGEPAFWIPFVAAPRPGAVEVVQVTAMLGDGVSLATAAAEVQSLGSRLRGDVAEPEGPPRFELVRTRDEAVRAVRPSLVVLAAGVAIVLLVVCANVANLLLVRGAGRHLEIGIRRALGAPTVVLVGAGIALGVAGALGLTRYLDGMLFGLTAVDAPTYLSVAIGFALVALVACYVPARRATKVDPLAALRVGD